MKYKFIDSLGNIRLVRNRLILEQLFGIQIEKDSMFELSAGDKKFKMKVIANRENEVVLKTVL